MTDLVVAAVPHSSAFSKIAEEWRFRPLVIRSGIQIVTVSQTGEVHGLDLTSA
jgi:hypothetical protein